MTNKLKPNRSAVYHYNSLLGEDQELQLMSAVIQLFSSANQIDVNAKARVANYINNKFGEYIVEKKQLK